MKKDYCVPRLLLLMNSLTGIFQVFPVNFKKSTTTALNFQNFYVLLSILIAAFGHRKKQF